MEEFKSLQHKYAYIMNKPITHPSQMLKDIIINVGEVDETVEDLVDEHKILAIKHGANPEFIDELEKKLCAFGGELLCYDIDEYAELIMKEGQLWYTDTMYFEQMQLGECHSNAIKLNEENPECPIVVGYALSPHGFWFTHTWLLASEEGEENNFVVETTTPAELYFGVVLNETLLEEFKRNYKE